LELKIPPLALVVLAAALMWLGAASFPAAGFRFPAQSSVAWGLGAAGTCVCALGVIEFKRARTTVNPTKPGSASSLVRTGIYRRSRNPMYLGFLVLLIGWAVAMGNVLALVIPPAFVAYMNRFQIRPEERALTALFGDAFRDYCRDVRRWF
jgi:protein-S-isoprenylcysteine O-methyltransferase Ste14